MRWIEILGEDVRAQVLYHTTEPNNMFGILHDNTLGARTTQRADRLINRGAQGGLTQAPGGFRQREIDEYGMVHGVSLTRDANFARRWKSGQGICLCLDGDKIKHDHRVIPYAHYVNRDESEEFVVGPIRNLSKYLLRIQVSQKTFDDLETENSRFRNRPYAVITDHPLLIVIGDRWNPLTGRVENTKKAIPEDDLF